MKKRPQITQMRLRRAARRCFACGKTCFAAALELLEKVIVKLFCQEWTIRVNEAFVFHSPLVTKVYE